MSALTWATFINEDTKESVSFHPVTLAGVISFGGTSPLIKEIFQPYGALEVLAGYSFTPYDSMIYGRENFLGDNLTLGFFGTFGIEFFSSDRISMFIESGGGFKTILGGDEENQYIIAASWLGSGVTFRMGTKIFF